MRKRSLSIGHGSQEGKENIIGTPPNATATVTDGLLWLLVSYVLDGRSLREACGVFGIYSHDVDVARSTYLGLHALQHRGQESAGIAVSDGENLTVVKDSGLVTSVFDEFALSTLQGHLGVGHVRYATSGSAEWGNAQPVYRTVGSHQFVLSHNGHLTNADTLENDAGFLSGLSGSDSNLIAELIIRNIEGTNASSRNALQNSLMTVLPVLKGAFSLVIANEHQLIGVRDPNGFRPLCLGKLGDGWVLASETPALDIIGATFQKEIAPGEMIIINENGMETLVPQWETNIDPRLCIFEFIYFSRPDATLYDRNVHRTRVRMGELLAEQHPVDADMVMGVPESGIPAAEGYSRASGVPYGQGLIKNRYIGRTFIEPNEQIRSNKVRMKLNPLRSNIENKRLIVVDDSIVRGTTSKTIVNILKDAGATEVHMRISSPPYRWPCYYGMDTSNKADLLATNRSVRDMRDYIGANSLEFMTTEDMTTAISDDDDLGFCNACFTKKYPTTI